MADVTTREILARLEVQDAKVAALQAELARYRGRHRRFRRLAPLVLVALLAALLPLSLLAANPFTDLNPGSVHNANIDAIYNTGITTGCVPNQQYCPNDFVTREQMASFLARTAGLGSNPPVANARTAQTVPDGAVTAAKLSGAGSTTGQALVSTGTGVAWQTVVGAQGPTGATGPQGPTGATGATGPPAGAGAIVRQATQSVAMMATVTVHAPCLAGERATGGGYLWGLSTDFIIRGSAPDSTLGGAPTGWAVVADNATLAAEDITAVVICVPAGP